LDGPVQDELFAASAAVGESPGNAELAQASGQPEGNFITYIYIYMYIFTHVKAVWVQEQS
jgi:hypothetical protein